MKIILLGSLVSLSCFAGIPQLTLVPKPQNIHEENKQYCYAPPIYAKALDDSMAQSGIHAGDILELDAGGCVRIGGLIAVAYQENQKDKFTFGTLQKDEKLLFKVQPDDSHYESFPFEYNQVFTISHIIKSSKK